MYNQYSHQNEKKAEPHDDELVEDASNAEQTFGSKVLAVSIYYGFVNNLFCLCTPLGSVRKDSLKEKYLKSRCG